MSFTVLGFFTNVVSLFDNFSGTVPKLSNKRNNIPL